MAAMRESTKSAWPDNPPSRSADYDTRRLIPMIKRRELLATAQRTDFAKWEKPVKASGFQAD